jgi:outer membrane protein assembly factor BamB
MHVFSRATVRFVIILASLFSSANYLHADDWPQWLGPKRDGVWRETGILTKLPKEGLKVLWRAPVDQGYSGPAVAEGLVFVTDWVRDANAKPPDNAFSRARMAGKERVHCLDAKTGEKKWSIEYDCPYGVSYPAGPRCTPLVHDGKVYTLGTMGDLLCLDVKDGTKVWSKNFVKDFNAKVPLWGFAGHPLLDGDRLICLVGGPDDHLAVALNKDTGKEIWHALSADEPGYAPPVIVQAGKTRQLIIWHPEAINALDPETGKVFWSQPFVAKNGLSVSMPRVSGDRLFITSFYTGCMMLQLSQEGPAARVLWQSHDKNERVTEGLHSIMPTPVLKDNHIYGICSYGQLRCLDMNSGARLWESQQATGPKEERWGNAFLIEHKDLFFLFNEHGELITAKLTPDGYEEISRTKIIEPTNRLAGRQVVWMHPAFANRCVYARNDKEIICVSLAETK